MESASAEASGARGEVDSIGYTIHTCPTAVPTRMFLEVMPYWVSVMPSAVTGSGNMNVFWSTMGTLDSNDENSSFHSGCVLRVRHGNQDSSR